MTAIFTKVLPLAMILAYFTVASLAQPSRIQLEGIAVTPHFKLDSMRYLQEPEPAVGARTQLFLRNTGDTLSLDGQTRVLVNGKTPQDLLAENALAWHDMPSALPDATISLPKEALTVWTINGRTAAFGPGSKMPIEVGPQENPWLSETVSVDKPEYWLSAVTFLGGENAIQPDSMIVHIVNGSNVPVTVESCRLWLPQDPKTPRVFFVQPALSGLIPFNGQATIPAGDRGGFSVKTSLLPLTYTVVEVSLSAEGKAPVSIWGTLRIKPEHFDISGGWVNGGKNPVSSEVFLKALKRLYVNTAHLAFTPGYSDTDLYQRYPLKYFNKLTPFETYDTDGMLPNIHAVEFLGEPQFGGGTPVPPQQVWQELQPYTVTRLATTITHSEERIWRDYAGLSDYPHYDAYRVTAPSPDAWQKYERWGKRIFWGSPLETIGDMCRSLRELNRPMPCAIWSQGPHEGWGKYGGRKRTSPTPDEIRLQAYHALSTRITSLYWFNLSLKTLVQWRDTLDELGRIGREMRLLDDFLLEGDACTFERLTRDGNQPDWDIASVCGPRAALLFALDLDYKADFEEKVFVFGKPRKAEWAFKLPAYLHGVTDVFRVDADGIYEAKWDSKDGAVTIHDKTSKVAVYIAALDGTLRQDIEKERATLVEAENALAFDPAHNDQDFAALEELLSSMK